MERIALPHSSEAIRVLVTDDGDDVRARQARALREELATAADSSGMLKPKDVATYLDVAPSHVYELLRGGRLPHVQVGGTYRIPTQWLAEWLARGGTRNVDLSLATDRHRSRTRSSRRWAR